MANRPRGYCAAIAAEICRRLTEGQSLRAICAEADMPARSTVMKWLFDAVPDGDPRTGFRADYARARQAQAELMAEEILAIADNADDDWDFDAKGNPKLNRDAIARSKLKVETRKWIIARLAPKKYGALPPDTPREGRAPPELLATIRRLVGELALSPADLFAAPAAPDDDTQGES